MQNIVKLSNRQTELADKAGASWKAHRRLDREAIAAYIETGGYLTEAKDACQHGEFGAVLARAGIPRHTAQRAMRLSAAGLKCDTVSHLGGVRRALEAIAIAQKSPDPPGVLERLIRLVRANDAVERAAEEAVEAMLDQARGIAAIRRDRCPHEGQWLHWLEHPDGGLKLLSVADREGLPEYGRKPLSAGRQCSLARKIAEAYIAIAESGMDAEAIVAACRKRDIEPDTALGVAEAIRQRAA